jgi:hypothetical protein
MSCYWLNNKHVYKYDHELILHLLHLVNNWFCKLMYPEDISGNFGESHYCSGEVNSIQHYVIKYVSDLWQVGGFLRPGLPVSSTNKTNHHDITEIHCKNLKCANFNLVIMHSSPNWNYNKHVYKYDHELILHLLHLVNNWFCKHNRCR